MHSSKVLGTVAAQAGLLLLAIACGGEAAHEAATDASDDTGTVDDGSAAASTTQGAGGTGAPNATDGEVSTTGTGETAGASDGAGGSGGADTAVTSNTANNESSVSAVGSTGTSCFSGCECSPQTIPIGLDEVSTAFVTANEVLAFATGTHQGILSYQSGVLNEVASVTFPSESTTLELTIEAVGTASNLMDMHIPESSPYCSNALGIDVRGTLTTEDGAFAEESTGVLTAKSGESAELYLPLSLEGLAGTFSPQVEPSGYGFKDEVMLTAHFGPGIFAGDLSAVVIPCSTPDCELYGSRIASWGQCPFGGHAIDTTKDPRVTLSDALEAWDSMPPLEAVWEDNSRSPVTLTLSADESLFCLDSDRYRFQAEITIESEDGRLSTSLPVVVDYLRYDEYYSEALSLRGSSGSYNDPPLLTFEFFYSHQEGSISIVLNGGLTIQESSDYETISFQ